MAEENRARRLGHIGANAPPNWNGVTPPTTPNLIVLFFAERQHLAALYSKLKGWEQSIPGVGPDPDEICLNQFTFAKDPGRVRCPFGAHVHGQTPATRISPGG